MDGIAGQQLHRCPALAEIVPPIEVTMPARMKSLALHRRHQLRVARRENGHDLLAPDLEQNIMLRVHVKRRHAARR